MNLKINKYIFVSVFLFLSCTPTPVEINSSEEVFEEVIISEEVWHWCYGNYSYLIRNERRSTYSGMLEVLDVNKLFYLRDTFSAAEAIYDEENKYGIRVGVSDEEREISIINKDEISLEICRIWFNINNP